MVRGAGLMTGTRNVAGRTGAVLRVAVVVVRRADVCGAGREYAAAAVPRSGRGLAVRRRARGGSPQGCQRDQKDAQQGDGETAEAAHYVS